jgi:hypothetical protein
MALPLIVAGPIVRRVEPKLATVWVALSVAGTVTLDIYQGRTTASNTGAPDFTSGPVPTKPFGANLHAEAITVTPDGAGFNPNTTYAYDLRFDLADGRSFDLQGLGLLQDETSQTGRTQGGWVDDTAPLNLALGYAPDELPTFLTCPSDLKDLVMVQAGCRNTGSSKQDAAGWIDEVIGGSNLERPHQLFMTGDQVYADSAVATLLPMMHEIGAELLGADPSGSFIETMLSVQDTTADADHPGANKELWVNMLNMPAHRRGWLCVDQAWFTTGSHSHILSFGEFAAAYCLAWNPSVWRAIPAIDEIFTDGPEDFDGDDQTSTVHPTSDIDEYLTPWSHFRGNRTDQEWEDKKTQDYGIWERKAEMYRETIPQVRRALANCATYMIHDDHEVTDDWNMSKEWVDRVHSSPLGRQVQRNGLSAAAVFQAWGNDPEKWAGSKSTNEKTFLDNVSTAWTAPDVANQLPNTLVAEDIENALRLPSDVVPVTELVTWHFEVNNESHKVLAIDTRTKRTFATRNSPPSLLGPTLNDQVPKRKDADGDDRVLVLLAPQPPLMPALFDQIAQPLASGIISAFADQKNKNKKKAAANKGTRPANHELAEMGDAKIEAESWGMEQVGLENLLRQLDTYKKVVILSGDVHFSYAMELDFWKKGSTIPSRYVQLTVSPSRHQWSPEAVHILLRTTALSNRLAELGQPAERLAWEKGSGEQPGVPTAPTQLPFGLATRAKRSPALLPARGWPADTVDPTAPPDWKWRLKLAADERSELDRPDSIRLPGIPANDLHDPEGPAITEPLTTYLELAESHQAQTKRQFTHLRRLVFPTAIGVVTFPEEEREDQPNVLEQYVKHRILTGDPDNPKNVNYTVTDGEPNTVHMIRLEPTEDDEPELQIGAGGDQS